MSLVVAFVFCVPCLWFVVTVFSSFVLCFFFVFGGFYCFSGGDLVALCVPGWLSFSLGGFIWVLFCLQGVLFLAFSLVPPMAVWSLLYVRYGVPPAPFLFLSFSYSDLL